MRYRNRITGIFLLFAILNCSQVFATKQKRIRTGTPLLWEEPTDITTRDLFLGAGGDAMKPDLSSLTYVKDRPGGYSKKYEVRDGSGRRWIAKLGKGAQSDTAANEYSRALKMRIDELADLPGAD